MNIKQNTIFVTQSMFIMIKKISILFLFISLFVTCGKKVENSNADFIGYWTGSDGQYYYTLNIESNSKATYNRCFTGANCVENKGKARIRNGKLKIGDLLFTIEVPPTNTGSGWTAKLSGISFTR